MSNDQTEHLPPDGTRSTRNQLGPQYNNALNLGSGPPPAQGYQSYQGQQAAPDYYRVHYMEQHEGIGRWWLSSADFPTREEADEHVKTMVASGAKSVRVTPGYWK